MTISISSPEDHIRNTEWLRLRALIEADIETATRLHASDFQLITPIGIALSRDEYLGAVASGRINYIAWEPEDIAVRVHDRAATIRYRARLEVVFNGHPVPSGRYWHTDTYEYSDNGWMVVWSHATAISG